MNINFLLRYFLSEARCGCMNINFFTSVISWGCPVRLGNRTYRAWGNKDAQANSLCYKENRTTTNLKLVEKGAGGRVFQT